MPVNLRYELRGMMKKDSAQMLALPWYLHVQTNLVLLNLDFTGYPKQVLIYGFSNVWGIGRT